MRVSITKLQGGGGYHCEVFAPNAYSMNAVVNAVTAITPAAGEATTAHAAVDIEHPHTAAEAQIKAQVVAATAEPILRGGDLDT